MPMFEPLNLPQVTSSLFADATNALHSEVKSIELRPAVCPPHVDGSKCSPVIPHALCNQARSASPGTSGIRPGWSGRSGRVGRGAFCLSEDFGNQGIMLQLLCTCLLVVRCVAATNKAFATIPRFGKNRLLCDRLPHI